MKFIGQLSLLDKIIRILDKSGSIEEKKRLTVLYIKEQLATVAEGIVYCRNNLPCSDLEEVNGMLSETMQTINILPYLFDFSNDEMSATEKELFEYFELNKKCAESDVNSKQVYEGLTMGGELLLSCKLIADKPKYVFSTVPMDKYSRSIRDFFQQRDKPSVSKGKYNVQNAYILVNILSFDAITDDSTGEDTATAGHDNNPSE